MVDGLPMRMVFRAEVVPTDDHPGQVLSSGLRYDSPLTLEELGDQIIERTRLEYPTLRADVAVTVWEEDADADLYAIPTAPIPQGALTMISTLTR